jgi:hypothetical protein
LAQTVRLVVPDQPDLAGAVTEYSADVELTPERLQEAWARVKELMSTRYCWVYGIEVGTPPFSGPLPCSAEQLVRWALAGLVFRDELDGRWYWTPQAEMEIRAHQRQVEDIES